jgi:predicted flap endonuclease-1-like 5' DNA nuclease
VQETAAVTAALKDLQVMPGIGPSLSQDLYELGVCRVTDLDRADPQALYDRHCQLAGKNRP